MQSYQQKLLKSIEKKASGELKGVGGGNTPQSKYYSSYNPADDASCKNNSSLYTHQDASNKNGQSTMSHAEALR